jgi:hypothetical protein
MRNLATHGFPVPDTDHQKHVSNIGDVLNVARLYIAMWMQTKTVEERLTRAGPSKSRVSS